MSTTKGVTEKQMVCMTCAVSLKERDRPVSQGHPGHLIAVVDVVTAYPVPSRLTDAR